MVDIDSETLFNTAAAILSTVAVLMFVFNVEFAYSPVSEVALVLLFLAAVFFLTQRTPDRQLTVLGYGVILAAGVGLFFDMANTFSVGNTLTVLGLLLIAGLLFALRTKLDEENHFLAGERTKYVLGVVAVLAVGVLLVDVVTGSLAYELQPRSEIEFADSRYENEVQIASVAVTNPTPFPERVEAPAYGACTAGNWSEFRRPSEPGEPQHDVRAHVSVRDRYGEHVFGFATKTYPVVLHLNGVNLTGQSFAVRATSTCPDDETGQPYIALFERPEDWNRRYFAGAV